MSNATAPTSRAASTSAAIPAVVELARFATKPESDAEFLATRDAALAAIRRAYPGLVSGTLVKLESTPERTVWMDIVFWDSLESAQEAAAHCMTIPEFQAMVQHISEELSMEHGVVVERY